MPNRKKTIQTAATPLLIGVFAVCVVFVTLTRGTAIAAWADADCTDVQIIKNPASNGTGCYTNSWAIDSTGMVYKVTSNPICNESGSTIARSYVTAKSYYHDSSGWHPRTSPLYLEYFLSTATGPGRLVSSFSTPTQCPCTAEKTALIAQCGSEENIQNWDPYNCTGECLSPPDCTDQRAALAIQCGGDEHIINWDEDTCTGECDCSAAWNSAVQACAGAERVNSWNDETCTYDGCNYCYDLAGDWAGQGQQPANEMFQEHGADGVVTYCVSPGCEVEPLFGIRIGGTEWGSGEMIYWNLFYTGEMCTTAGDFDPVDKDVDDCDNFFAQCSNLCRGNVSPTTYCNSENRLCECSIPISPEDIEYQSPDDIAHGTPTPKADTPPPPENPDTSDDPSPGEPAPSSPSPPDTSDDPPPGQSGSDPPTPDGSNDNEILGKIAENTKKTVDNTKRTGDIVQTELNKLNSKASDIVENTRIIANNTKRTGDILQTELNKLNAKSTDIKNAINTTGKYNKSINYRLASIVNHLSSIKNGVSGTNTRLDGLGNKLDGIGDSLNGIKDAVTDNTPFDTSSLNDAEFDGSLSEEELPVEADLESRMSGFIESAPFLSSIKQSRIELSNINSCIEGTVLNQNLSFCFDDFDSHWRAMGFILVALASFTAFMILLGRS